MATAVQVLAGLPIVIGATVLAVDTGWMTYNRDRLQDVADAAALAAATRIGDESVVDQLAIAVAASNDIDGVPVTLDAADVTIGTWDGAAFTADPTGDFVQVAAHVSSLHLLLGSLLGIRTIELYATSVAGVANEGGGTASCVMFADDEIELNGSAIVKGYDSTTGEETVASVCTNLLNIETQGNYQLHGDARPGPDGTCTVSGSSWIYGDCVPLPEELTVPSPAMPLAGLTFSTDVKKSITLVSGATYKMTSGFKVNANGKLVVNGEVHVYASGDVEINGNGMVNSTGIPSNFVLHVVGAHSVHINGNSDFYGIIDAPDSDVELNGNADFYGTVVANKIKHNGNHDVWLDTSLADEMGTLVEYSSGHARLAF